ncbi:MAG: hypothetical protein ACRDRB_08895 [Pseudonocardiaceae bacterium]
MLLGSGPVDAGEQLYVVLGRDRAALFKARQLGRLDACRSCGFSAGEPGGRGPDVLYVRFAGEGQLISVSPALVRLLPDAPGVG